MENFKECKHNPRDSYTLFCIRSRLHWLKTTNPNIYWIYNEKGEFAQGVCDQAYQKEIDEARRKGLRVELQDNSEETRELEASIERLEKLAKEHKENCKGYIFKMMEDGTPKYVKN